MAYGMAGKAPYRYIESTSGGSQTSKTEEDLTSQVDGSNQSFTISQSFVADSIEVFYNGIKQRTTNEFTVVNSTTIQTVFVPSSNSTLTVFYSS